MEIQKLRSGFPIDLQADLGVVISVLPPEKKVTLNDGTIHEIWALPIVKLIFPIFRQFSFGAQFPNL